MPRVKKSSGKPPDPLSARDLAAEDHLADDCEEASADDVRVSIVKMKLSRFCDSKQIRSRLECVVRDANVLMAEAYTFANFHVARLLEAKKPPPVIDRNFYYRCILAVSVNRARSKTLGEDFQESIVVFDTLRPEGQTKVDIRELNQLVADLSITMGTMASNHLWLNLEPRLARYLRWRHPELSKRRLGLVQKVTRAVVSQPARSLSTLFTPPKKASEEVVRLFASAASTAAELRAAMPLPSAAQTSKVCCLTLPLYARILRETNAKDAEWRKRKEAGEAVRHGAWRSFTLLPTKGGLTVANIPISSMTLIGLLRKLNLVHVNGDGRNEDRLAIWRKFFNTRLVETKTRAFGLRILTDGCAVSIQMSTATCACCSPPSLGLDEASRLRSCKGIRFAAVDPGITDVVTVTEMEGALPAHRTVQRLHEELKARYGDLKTQSYSSARFYEVAKYKLSARRVAHWTKETSAMVKTLKTCEVAGVEELTEHARSYLAVARQLMEHRMARGFRNMRFLRYVHKHKAIDQVCEMIAPRSKGFTVVGFEDWQGVGQCPVSRRTCGPVQEIKKRLSQLPHVRLLSVDKFRTSKVCCGCHGELTNKKAVCVRFKTHRDEQSGDVKRVRCERVSRIHKVLHCKSSAGGSRSQGSQTCHRATTWDRDANASRNILLLTLCQLWGYRRPAAFCRQQTTPTVLSPKGPSCA